MSRAKIYQREHVNQLHALPEEYNLVMQGHGGLTFSKVFQTPAKFIVPIGQSNPDVLFIDIGTNDLCDHSIIPSVLVEKVFKFLDLLDYFKVKPKCIILLSVIQRTEITRKGQVSVSTFNHRAKRYNSLLAAKLTNMHPKVQMLSQSRINIPKYIADGCHLNNDGMLKYVSNVYNQCIKVGNQLDKM